MGNFLAEVGNFIVEMDNFRLEVVDFCCKLGCMDDRDRWHSYLNDIISLFRLLLLVKWLHWRHGPYAIRILLGNFGRCNSL